MKFFITENACDVEKASEGDDTPALEMENVGGCFLVLLGGVCIAILLAVFEFLWNIHRISVEQKVYSIFFCARSLTIIHPHIYRFPGGMYLRRSYSLQLIYE